MSNKIKIILTVSVALLLLVVVILQLYKGSNNRRSINDPYFAEGQRLSEIHCAGCHKYPDPELLPWRTWRFETLAAMAPFLGIEDPHSAGAVQDPRRNPSMPDNIYPSEAQVTQEEWQKIRDYYLQMAPEQLPSGEQEPAITVDSLFFKARYPAYRPDNPASVTAIKFDPGNRLIYLSDSNERRFMVFNQNLNRIHYSKTESPISHIRFLDDETEPGLRYFLLTFIGHLAPSDSPYGSVVNGRYDPELQVSDMDSVLWEDITRPVQSQPADLNGDGLDDLLVNEFGHRGGSLFWLENRGEKRRPEKKVLIAKPGCIQSYAMDFNGNGRSDILALCTQTDQAIYLFSNKGNGEFVREALLTFEVTAGSSSFEVHDFNDDGEPDILYTSGDNADYSKIFKPYHGVYIYLNEGNNRFSNEWFYPINGAYNAKARDFSGNGRLDLAVISYFADYKNSPEEGFIFFKNEGNLSFTPYHHPSASEGRWITMDVADWTGNGRDDIILGSFPEGPMQGADHVDVQDKWERGPLFLLLENMSDEVK